MNKLRLEANVRVFHSTPYGYAMYAKDFFSAGKSHQSTIIGNPATNFLVARSLELCMKAFLLINDVEKSTIKLKLGHNLNKLYKECNQHKLNTVMDVSQDDEALIGNLKTWYHARNAAYFSMENMFGDNKQAPDIDKFATYDLCERMLKSIEPLCLKYAHDAHDSPT